MSITATSVKGKLLTGIVFAVCILLSIILVLNVILIVKSYTNEDEVPSISGIMPFIVLSPSMDPIIKEGDIVIVKKADPKDIKVGEDDGDVISFFDPSSKSTSVVTHRAIDVRNGADGGLEFKTKGDNNDINDPRWVPEKNVVGVYQFRIPLLGKVAMFMQSTEGFVICIGLPVVALVAYDIIRRRRQERENKADTDALLLELAALRAEKENRDKE